MARDCIRALRHVIVPLVIGRQPDLLGGPTVTHERAVKPTPQTWSRDMLRYLQATSPDPEPERHPDAG